MEKSPYRLQVLEKINDLEKAGMFNEEVEENPPSKVLMPDDVDYLQKKLIHRINAKIATHIAKKYIQKLMKQKKLIIKEVIGFEKIKALNTGYILTCNHFNPYDNFALHMILVPYLRKQKKKFFKVIREGNYSFPGIYGYFFRNCYTLPLSSNFTTMKNFTKAVETILTRGDVILIYPEQSMWWNYRKPRPLKVGAFKYAEHANVPIVPCFITMTDTDALDEDGFPIQAYTINFLDPLYPDQSLSAKDCAQDLCNRNYQVWKEKYEEFYKIPLVYNKE